MEAAFLSGFASASLQLLLNKFADFTLPEISLLRDLDVELKKLQRSFLRIQAMVDFVEHMHIRRAGSGGNSSSSSSKKAWQVWLEDLKNLLYEADDLLDDIYLNFSKFSADGNNKVSGMLLSFLNVTVPHKVAKLHDKLEKMSNEMNLFFTSGVNKIEAYGSDNTTNNDVIRKSLMVNDELIVGREREREEIFSMVYRLNENIVVYIP